MRANETMRISLKDKNKPLLSLVFLANIVIYQIVLYEGITVANWIEMFTSIQNLVPVLLIFIVTGIINAQINHHNKARLVFWKWSKPLPGCYAFTEYMSSDSRIDKEALQKHQDPLPTDPDKQNALWFKWYREFQNEAGIIQVHRKYLFARDYAGISFLLIVGLGSLALWQMESFSVRSIYLAFLLLQYLMVRQAARNHGVRFVASVLAYKASSDLQGEVKRV